MKKELPEEKILRIIAGGKVNSKEEMINHNMHEDEISRKKFESYVDVWEKSADISEFEKIDVNRDWQKVRTRMKFRGTRKRLPFKTFIIRIAAILVLAIGLTYLFIGLADKISGDSAAYIEETASIENSLVELPDGSLIYMNKNAKIIRNSNFGETNRDIILEGEAYFEVIPDQNLPFRVHTLNSIVEVLGTKFNVKTTDQLVAVGVITGKVALYPSEDKSRKIELLSETTGIFDTGSKTLTFNNKINPNLLAWHTGKFYFDKMPLNEVCETLAEYYGLQYMPDTQANLTEPMHINPMTISLDDIILNLNLSVKENVKIINHNGLLIVKKY